MKPEEQMPDSSPTGPVGNTVREQDKIMLVLSYIWVLSLIPLLTVNDSEYVKWHAKNGLVLGFGGIFALMFLGFIPLINLLVCPAWLGLVVLSVVAIMKALNGERWRIPVVSDLAEKF